jgi:hypothetical protein
LGSGSPLTELSDEEVAGLKYSKPDASATAGAIVVVEVTGVAALDLSSTGAGVVGVNAALREEVIPLKSAATAPRLLFFRSLNNLVAAAEVWALALPVKLLKANVTAVAPGKPP